MGNAHIATELRLQFWDGEIVGEHGVVEYFHHAQFGTMAVVAHRGELIAVKLSRLYLDV